MTLPAFGLTPAKDVDIAEITADERLVFAAHGEDPQMLWTPAKAARAQYRDAANVRIDVGLESVEGELVTPCVYIDWGDGFSEETCATLKRRGGGYFAILPARSRALTRVRLDPSAGPCQFVVTHFEVQPIGSLGPDPRGWRGEVIEVLKTMLGPLRRPTIELVRRARSLVKRGRGMVHRVRLSADGGPWREAYTHALHVAKNLRSPHYAAPIIAPIALKPDAPRLVAFYLPQFHPFPENDAWWGRGFTEWTNVTKATPQFEEHYQPRLASDLGYYDLRQRATFAHQIDLARGAGIGAFCFHYYWFGGKRLMEAPLDLYLDDASLDLPFALCWANENWTRRWDGAEGEILIAQQHSPEDDIAVFDDIARYMADPRYLRVAGRPVLVVYRPDILPDVRATTERWRARARALGLGELRLLCTTAFGFSDHAGHGFDGLVDFPPHAISIGEITDQVVRLNPGFSGKVYDYEQVVDQKIKALARSGPDFVPGVMPGWDNEARKPGAGHVFHGAEPDTYRRWLTAALNRAVATTPKGEALVFVNAWNEWAEGAYLEPDRWFGHGYLQATRAAMTAFSPRLTAEHPLVREAAAAFVRRGEAVVILHLYYPELIDWFAQRLAGAAQPMDVMITVPDTWSEAELAAARAAFPRAWLAVSENRGRDVLPFIHALRQARTFGYKVFCKLHSKRSPHMRSGDDWRASLVEAVASETATATALDAFAKDPELGLLAPAASRMRLGDPDVLYNNRDGVERLADRMKLSFGDETPFAAGSMFWGRVEAFDALTAVPDADFGFEVEMGRIDGTTAHALERLTGAIVIGASRRASFSL